MLCFSVADVATFLNPPALLYCKYVNFLTAGPILTPSIPSFLDFFQFPSFYYCVVQFFFLYDPTTLPPLLFPPVHPGWLPVPLCS